MARLADEILKGLQAPPWVPADGLAAEPSMGLLSTHARKIITYDPIIDVSNVADFVWDQQQSWSTVDKDQFPCLTPPFESFFMEYRRPPFFTHERDDLQTEEGKKRFGSLRVGKSDWVRAPTTGWPIERYGVAFDSIDLHTGQTINDFVAPLKGVNTSMADKIDPNSRWILRGTLYIKQRGEKYAQGPMGFWIGGLDEHGVLMRDAAVGFPGMEWMDAEERFYWSTMLMPTFVPPLRAISYMHCKNISQEPVRPEAKLSRAYQRKHGRPLLSYRTLVIEPLMAGSAGRGGGGGGGLKSHHFRRGHFADYRHGKGLFGKESLKRIFWVDMTMVGSKEVGEVLGDYAVKAPR